MSELKNRLKTWFQKHFPERSNQNDSRNQISSNENSSKLSDESSNQLQKKKKTENQLLTTINDTSTDEPSTDNLSTSSPSISDSPMPGPSTRRTITPPNSSILGTSTVRSPIAGTSTRNSPTPGPSTRHSPIPGPSTRHSPTPGPSSHHLPTSSSITTSSENVGKDNTKEIPVSKDEMKIFENDIIMLFVYKASHQRQRKFRFQDAMFHVKAVLKDNSHPPLLKDLLETLETALNYMLQHLKSFFELKTHNIAFLTLWQSQFVNGLNTGAFNIDNEPHLLVDKLLSMLNNFLISNQNLELNDSFKIYVNVLSVDKEKYHQFQNKRKQKRKRHLYGMKIKKTSRYNQFWAFDIPQSFSFKINLFENQCILLALILSHLQNAYFENSRDLRYVHAQGLLSNVISKQKKAIKILNREIETVCQNINLPLNEQLDISEKAALFSNYFKCQIIIFAGTKSNTHIKFMYPSKFESSLKPTYLYESLESSSHVVFIKHIKSFFRANQTICLACKKSFKSPGYRHFCTKYESCFACRRFFQNENTYVNKNNLKEFCNGKLVFAPSFLCKICNTTLLSNECAIYHKQLCGKKGLLGYKCLKCKKFNYRSGQHLRNVEELKKNHKCGEKVCKYCKQYYFPNENNLHVCKLQNSIIKEIRPNLVFLNFEFFENISANCELCYQIKNDFILKNKISWSELFQTNDWKELVCKNHQFYDKFASEPKFISILKENRENQFILYELIEDNPSFISKIDSVFSFTHDNRMLSKKTKLQKSYNFFESNMNVQANKNDAFSSMGDLFCQLILSSGWENSVFICQDQNGLILKWIHSQFLKKGLAPYIIFRGNRIYSMEFKQFKIKFVNSNNYLEGNEYELALQQDIIFNRLFFPKNVNFCQWKFYAGSLPPFQLFLNFDDSNNLRDEKEMFYKNKKSSEWIFMEELANFSKQKVLLLCESICIFIQNCFLLQNNIMLKIDPTNRNFGKLIHPFQEQLVSMPSFIMKVFKSFYLLNEDIFCVMNEYGSAQRNSSKLEFEIASFLEFENPEACYRHNFNHIKGQKYFKSCIPDLYSEKEKEAIFINGCYIHGHLNCLQNPNSSEASVNFTNKTYQELNNEFDNKIARLLNENQEEVTKIKIIWECEFENNVKNTETFKRFHKAVFLQCHPLERLKPRTCVRGGFLNTYALKWKKNSMESFYCLDINGLYSYCAINFEYVIGKYDIIIGDNVKKINIVNNKLYYNNQKIFGAIQLTILAPNNLLYPFLPIKLSNNKTVLTLCKKCSEIQNKKKCDHNQYERALTSCYMINEIEFALSLGYEVIAIYECHVYYKQKPFLRDFVQYLNVLKMKHSDLFKTKTVDEHKDYCAYLNKNMQLKDNLSLQPEDIKPNSKLKNLYKLAANSFFGKLQQRSDFPKSVFASSQTELEELFLTNEDRVENILCHNDIICELLVQPDVLKLAPNRTTNCYVGAQITSYARQVIFNQILILQRAKANLFYVDTDSVFFTLLKDKKVPLNISDSLGHFKNVVEGEIINFYCLGSKNYMLLYKTCQNETKSICKLRGLSLNSVHLQNEIDSETYETYLESYIKGITLSKSINQLRKFTNKNAPTQTKIEVHTLSNQINVERVLLKDEIYSTLPFGYL